MKENPLPTDQITQNPYPTLAAVREAAIAHLQPAVADFLEGGAGDEVTLRRNRQAFEQWAFVPEVMNGREPPSLATRFMGVDLSLPVLTAPFGADGLFHPDGQLATARACAASGTTTITPELGTHSLEHVAAAADGAVAFGQIHPMGSESVFLDVARRYHDAGYTGLCVTVDIPVEGWRPRDRGNRYLPDLPLFVGNYTTISTALAQAGQLLEHRTRVWSWKRLGEVLDEASLPWMAKGIMTAADALAALEAGASALVVSNHGGRQLDGQRASLDALPEIREAVGPAVDIALDSGVRSGVDVVKALALGADAVLIGRLAVYGLTAGGEDGVRTVLELLRDEIATVLTLLGRGGVGDVGRDALVRNVAD
jgi:4-hydroxymandelate oxidase